MAGRAGNGAGGSGTSLRRLGLGCLVVGLVGFLVVLVATIGLLMYAFRDRPAPPPTPHCVATTGDHAVRISSDQAWWTSIIVGTSLKRGLPARAASIAMATVYQETGIRNLDHGDRDSVGLFQQRPSQGWGTVEQIMDPYYSTGRFYDALVKVDDWEKGDITTVAQAVQRSGHPEAYRKHEGNARALASTFTGWTPAGLSCIHDVVDADAEGLDAFLVRTLGVAAGDRDGDTVTYRVGSKQHAWSIAHVAVATGARFGTTEVQVADRRWGHDRAAVAPWQRVDTPLEEGHVTVVVGS